MTENEWATTDEDGDTLTIERHDDGRLLADAQDETAGENVQVFISREAALSLYQDLGAYLIDTAQDGAASLSRHLRAVPDAETDGYAWPAAAGESVAIDAHHAVYGDRQDDYGHPREDFTRTAIIWTALLQHKLAPGFHIEAEDIARCMIGVKLARDVHKGKRDNRTDIAGYAVTLDRLETGR